MAGQSAQRYGFPSSQRLHLPAEFTAVMSSRTRRGRDCFELRVCAQSEKAPVPLSGARLGLIIPKRFARQAVLRNLLKRLARESFRHARPQLPAVDLVLRLVKPPLPVGVSCDDTRRWAWRQAIDSLLAGVSRC